MFWTHNLCVLALSEVQLCLALDTQDGIHGGTILLQGLFSECTVLREER